MPRELEMKQSNHFRRLLLPTHSRCLLLGLALMACAPAALGQERPAHEAEEVTIRANGYTLAGTLLLPRGARGRVPAAVMITGSGPQTRDSELRMPGLENYRPFRQIAERLASRGIAVLRVDDRGIGGSTGRETLESATTSSFADDTRAQVAYLRARREIDPQRIALIGHSEGASIAMMVASTDARIRAIVLLAAMGKTGEEVNLAQQEEALAQIPNMTEERKEALRAQQRQILRTIIEGGDMSQLPPEARLPWFREFLTFDPQAVIRRVRQPILILHGELDKQVNADQATLLESAARAAGNRDVTKRVFPRLNHLLLPATTGAWSEYTRLSTYALDESLLNAIADWLQPRLRAGR